MKAKFYAKKLDGKGHVYLNTISSMVTSGELGEEVRKATTTMGQLFGSSLIKEVHDEYFDAEGNTEEWKVWVRDYWYSLQDLSAGNLPEAKRVELEHFIRSQITQVRHEDGNKAQIKMIEEYKKGLEKGKMDTLREVESEVKLMKSDDEDWDHETEALDAVLQLLSNKTKP